MTAGIDSGLDASIFCRLVQFDLVPYMTTMQMTSAAEGTGFLVAFPLAAAILVEAYGILFSPASHIQSLCDAVGGMLRFVQFGLTAGLSVTFLSKSCGLFSIKARRNQRQHPKRRQHQRTKCPQAAVCRFIILQLILPHDQ